MNIDREVRWGARVHHVLDRVRSGNFNERQSKRLPLDMVEQRFGWLDDYREELSLWQELSSIGQRSCSVIRRHGYGRKTIAALQLELRPAKHSSARHLSDKILEQVKLVRVARTCSGHRSSISASNGCFSGTLDWL